MKFARSTWTRHGISTEERSELLKTARTSLLKIRERRNLTYRQIGEEADLTAEKVAGIASWMGTYETYQKICEWINSHN